MVTGDWFPTIGYEEGTHRPAGLYLRRGKFVVVAIFFKSIFRKIGDLAVIDPSVVWGPVKCNNNSSPLFFAHINSTGLRFSRTYVCCFWFSVKVIFSTSSLANIAMSKDVL